VVISLKSDQDKSQRLKKQKKGLFNRSDRSTSLSERRKTKGKIQTESAPKTQTKSRRPLSLFNLNEPKSSSSTSQLNSSMPTVKPNTSKNSSSQPKSTNSTSDNPSLFNFSARRSPRQSKLTNSLPENGLTSASRRQRRQKSKKIQSLPLNTAQNDIVKRSSSKNRSGKSSPQLPLTATSNQNKPNSSPPKKAVRKPRKKPPSLFVYIVRLLILGIGIGAIMGTLLSVLDANHNILTGEPLPKGSATKKLGTVSMQPPILEQEIAPLKAELKSLTDQYQDLSAGIFMVDLDNENYINTNADMVFPAASTIKIPILMAFFQDVDQGKIRLDQTLVMEQDVMAGGSGEMQYQKAGTNFTALETATKMIVISDNTATNMIIKLLGGKEALNKRFQEWGLTNTIINNLLPDLEGTNTTTPKDLGNILGLINQGDILSLKSRDRVLEIMRQTKTRTLLPQGLGEGASIAHKTGDIGTVLGDAGVIDMPNGKRYIASVLVKRPHNDVRGRTLIQGISRTIYEYLEKNPAVPTPITTPVPTPTNSNP
jgi:beta-lactamase class A